MKKFNKLLFFSILIISVISLSSCTYFGKKAISNYLSEFQETGLIKLADKKIDELDKINSIEHDENDTFDEAGQKNRQELKDVKDSLEELDKMATKLKGLDASDDVKDIEKLSTKLLENLTDSFKQIDVFDKFGDQYLSIVKKLADLDEQDDPQSKEALIQQIEEILSVSNTVVQELESLKPPTPELVEFNNEYVSITKTSAALFSEMIKALSSLDLAKLEELDGKLSQLNNEMEKTEDEFERIEDELTEALKADINNTRKIRTELEEAIVELKTKWNIDDEG